MYNEEKNKEIEFRNGHQKISDKNEKINSFYLFPHLSIFRSIAILISRFKELNQLISNNDLKEDLFISLLAV